MYIFFTTFYLTKSYKLKVRYKTVTRHKNIKNKSRHQNTSSAKTPNLPPFEKHLGLNVCDKNTEIPENYACKWFELIYFFSLFYSSLRHLYTTTYRLSVNEYSTVKIMNNLSVVIVRNCDRLFIFISHERELEKPL